MGKELDPEQIAYVTTKSPEAYRYYIKGMNAFYKNDFSAARELFLQALAIDSNLYAAKLNVAYSYSNQRNFREAKKWAREVYEEKNQAPFKLKVWADLCFALYFKTPYDEIKYLEQILEFDDQLSSGFYTLGIAYNRINQFEKAIPELEKALALFDKWGVKPPMVTDYTALGRAYHELGLYRKEKKLYQKAEKDFPDDIALLPWQAIMELSKGKTKKANEYIEKFIAALEALSAPESIINGNLAQIYSQAGIHDKAKEH